MLLSTFVLLLVIATVGLCINRPVYKIILTQKGFAQFLQYDVDTPPLREFTFCTWIRIHDLKGDQTIFTYVANGNNRVIRLWLDSGGNHMKIMINDKASSVPVDSLQGVWRHVCFSYQSDHGAWALYIDARLVSCEAAQSLFGFVVPGGGSVIIGYGTDDNGAPAGLQGEIYGANMFLSSTIERNYTIKNHPSFLQKTFERNKVKGVNNIEYVILHDLKPEGFHQNIHKVTLPPFLNQSSKSYIKVNHGNSFIEHDVGLNVASKKPQSGNSAEILDVTGHDVRSDIDENKINFWSLLNPSKLGRKPKTQPKIRAEQSGSGTHELPMISEYETPPPPSSSKINEHTEISMETDISPIPESFFEISGTSTKSNKNTSNKRHMNEILEDEVPPPLDKEMKVYGQWTSSRFAGSVLNYLKTINFRNKEKKIPATIPLIKTSDTFPYASVLKHNIVQPPVKLHRKYLNKPIEKQFNSRNIYERQSKYKNLHIRKREATLPQINVQIIEDDVRNDILRSHAQTNPKHVEVTVRGEPKKNKEYRFYRNVDDQKLDENSAELKLTPFNKETSKYKKHNNNFNIQKNTNSLLTVLPFLKSIEYYTEDSQDSELDTRLNNMYSKSLSNANKWHNVKSYNNDYTPRHINIQQGEGETDTDYTIADTNKQHPSIRMKYKAEDHKVVKTQEETILKGRELAMEVSNQSNNNKDSVSILKYNHGFLPGRYEKLKKTSTDDFFLDNSTKRNILSDKHNFYKHVKIGNALSEQHVIGVNEEQKKRSFVGGNERIPDIQRYRSDLDNETDTIPSSLQPRVCKNVELYDRTLYIQPDESIDMTHILSPVKAKNSGIEFVLQNYKRCSLEETALSKSPLLFIHWSRTPVRLFGGAFPKRTTDLCGFF